MATITSANSIVVLSVPGLIGSTIIQGYAADGIWTSDAMDNKEVLMGLDGKLSAGWVPVSFHQTYTLQANSPSGPAFFDVLWASEQQLRDTYSIGGQITLTGLGLTFKMINGTLRTYTPIATAARVLQPRSFTIEWESVQPQGI